MRCGVGRKKRRNPRLPARAAVGKVPSELVQMGKNRLGRHSKHLARAFLSSRCLSDTRRESQVDRNILESRAQAGMRTQESWAFRWHLLFFYK